MRPGRGERGFTLIEVMLVIAVIGLVATSAVVGFRHLARSDLRTSAAQLAGALRYLYDRASATGKMHRLVFDFEEGSYWAEVSDDRFFLPRQRETEERRLEEEEQVKKEEEEAKEREEAQQAMGDSQYDLSRYQPEEFRPKRARFNAFKETALRPVRLKSGVRLAGLFTPRLAEPVASGKGYVYFFPLGTAEQAFVHLSDESQETFYTLVVHPLTGRVRIENRYLPPPVDEQTDDEGNRLGDDD